jgi:hypothetical protein
MYVSCSYLFFHVDLRGILLAVPLHLSQEILFSLLQQLAFDINNNSPLKLVWIIDVANAIIPTDPIIAYSTINAACLQLLVLTSQVLSVL